MRGWACGWLLAFAAAPAVADKMPAQPPALSLHIAGPSTTSVAETVLLDVVITNGGTTAIADVALRVHLPAGLEQVASPGAPSLRQKLGTLAAGDRKTVQLAVRAQREAVFETRALVFVDLAKVAAATHVVAVGATNAPAGYLGCFADGGGRGDTKARDLDGFRTADSAMTPARCVDICTRRRFEFAGVQYGKQCFCGDRHGAFGPATNCNMLCAGDGGNVCGGFWANSVYRVGRARDGAGELRLPTRALRRARQSIEQLSAAPIGDRRARTKKLADYIGELKRLSDKLQWQGRFTRRGSPLQRRRGIER